MPGHLGGWADVLVLDRPWIGFGVYSFGQGLQGSELEVGQLEDNAEATGPVVQGVVLATTGFWICVGGVHISLHILWNIYLHNLHIQVLHIHLT